MNRRAFLVLAFLMTTGREARAQWYCPRPVVPTVTDVHMAAEGDLVTKLPIVYVAGRRLDVTMTIPDCTDVVSVREDGRGEVTFLKLEDTSLGDGRHRVRVSIFFDNDGRGRSAVNRIVVGSVGGTVLSRDWTSYQTEYVFTRVGVKKVGGRMAMTISEGEIRNRFLMSIFGSYGPEGRSNEGGSVTPYDPAYALADEPKVETVSGTGFTYMPPQLALEEGKIHFGWSSKVSIPYWCDPTVRVWGRFGFEVDQPSGPEGRYVHVVWDGGEPSADISSPCGVIDWVVVNVGRFFGAKDQGTTVKEKVKNKIQDMVDQAVGACPLDPATGRHVCTRTGIDPTLLDPTVAIHKDYLTVEVFSPETITIEVPYGMGDLATAGAGLALNARDQVIVTASNQVSACTFDFLWGEASPSTCPVVPMGPQGLYNMRGWNPFFYPNLGYSNLADDELDAYRALLQVSREPSMLPDQHENVGAVLARPWFASRPVPLSEPCLLVGDPNAEARVAFGVNDHRTSSGAELGRGVFDVHVTWPIVGALPLPRCDREPMGGIAARWGSLGGDKGFLGRPLTDEIVGVSGRGGMTHFERGSIAWDGERGIFFVIGGIRQRWADMSWDRGPLGFPTSDEVCSPDPACRARLSRFQKGTIVWTPTSGTRAVVGPIHAGWKARGAEAGDMGLPTSEEASTGPWYLPGRRQDFEGGVFYSSARSGAHMVREGILAKWKSLGAESGFLSYPTTDETATTDGNGAFNDFLGGSIYWHRTYGARAVHGSIRDYWLGQRGIFGTLGWPTSDQYTSWYIDRNVPTQRFEGGTVLDTRPWGGVIVR
ncbi:MAG: hypothetical protein HY698_17765 [Deltaproteobacteria bacterium]|nr:hypothetical protein [Deltaproteobacteria bacterium]